ncbi:MAG: M48 family metalloprotease [Candidatus Obscuribacter sp.]|nr:M48 family metalloprotease [Candidatus Obscuribacter sp.]
MKFGWQPWLILGLALAARPLLVLYNSGKNLKRLYRCQSLLPGNFHHERLERMVKEVVPLAGLQAPPEIMVAPLNQPNIMVTGRGPGDALLVVTEEFFLVSFSDSELRAIVSHELAHLKRRDTASSALFTAFGLASTLSLFFSAPEPVTGILVLLVSSFLVKQLLLIISRNNELLADALSAKWTGDPCALVSALEMLESWHESSEQPFVGDFEVRLEKRWWQLEHPTLAVRSKALEKIAGEACVSLR